ncbi:hypothetical protein [Neobacillus cucumis]|uniref:hypothetical protein n=1 Tax=Neobacillus cucumis TaxID=1740721 RepID=UPI0019638BC2|nr:hypothetical protein [Neobacillus cucumis]MBM7654180.1 hypothetical protein [Neobacillus cucumis]
MNKFAPIESVKQVGHYDFDIKGFSQEEFTQASYGMENRVIVWLYEVSGTGVQITYLNERQDMHIRFWSKEEGDKYGFTYILDK